MDNPDMENEETKFFRIGSALDCLLTSPERWEEDFIVVDAIRPYGFMGKFIDNLPSNLTMDSPVEMYQEAYDKAGYKMNIYKVIEKFWSTQDILDYYLATRQTENKTVISKDEYESVTKALELINANEFVYKYFKKTSNWHEIIKQVPIYFRYLDEDCKALLDGILIDHENKTIQPYDLKTIGKSVYDFPISYLQFGYYRQCAFYEIALLSENSPVKQFLDDGYQLLDFVFIVVETKISSSHPAIVFRTSKQDRLCGVYGGKAGRKYYKGINELISDYKYHKVNDYWDLPKSLYESSGEIKLDVFNDAEEYEVLTPNVGVE